MIYLFLADGFEEIEAIAVVDILRRAELEVKTVGLNSIDVLGSHSISIKADIKSNEINFDDMEMIILPGGLPGTLNLEKDEFVQNSIKYAYENNKYLCAICAAPSIFGHLGLLKDKFAVSHPSFSNELTGAKNTEDRVVVDGKIITSVGAGSAMEFALRIVEILKSEELSLSLSKSMMCK